MVEVRDGAGYASTTIRAEFPHPCGGRTGSAPGFPRTREWLTKAEVTMTGVEENWLTGRLTGALNLGKEEAGKERKAGAETTEDGEKIGAFYTREQRSDGGCSFMGASGFCNFVPINEFGRVDKDKARRRGGAEAKVAGKRPSEGSGGSIGEKKQRNE